MKPKRIAAPNPSSGALVPAEDPQAAPSAGTAARARNRGRQREISPVLLTEDEAEAVVYALALAVYEEQPKLAEAVRSVIEKIVAASPTSLRQKLRSAVANAAQPAIIEDFDELIEIVEEAIRDEQKLRIVYCDQSGGQSLRTIKPLAWAESRSGESVAAWCELRGGFRNFRVDRIEAIVPLQSFFKGERDTLLNGYLARGGG